MLPAALAGLPGVSDVEVRYFEVDERLSQITRGSLVAAEVLSVAQEFDVAEPLEQRELVLTYNAWRTMLGRAQAASVLHAERGFGEDGQPNVIRIDPPYSKEAGRRWTLVLTLDDDTVLRANLPEREGPPFTVEVPGYRRKGSSGSSRSATSGAVRFTSE
jgi:hypothetical protein